MSQNYSTFAHKFGIMETKQYALVTGASSGMGLEFARQLAQRGYNLLIVSNVPEIYEAAKELKPTPSLPKGKETCFTAGGRTTSSSWSQR